MKNGFTVCVNEIFVYINFCVYKFCYLFFSGLLAKKLVFVVSEKYLDIVVGEEKIRLYWITSYELNGRYPDLVL